MPLWLLRTANSPGSGFLWTPKAECREEGVSFSLLQIILLPSIDTSRPARDLGDPRSTDAVAICAQCPLDFQISTTFSQCRLHQGDSPRGCMETPRLHWQSAQERRGQVALLRGGQNSHRESSLFETQPRPHPFPIIQEGLTPPHPGCCRSCMG